MAAQEKDRDAEQNERRADHPDEEDMRVGRVGLISPCEDAQRLVVQLNPDFDQRSVAISVDPEGPADLCGDLVCQNGIENREEGLRARGRQFGFLFDIDAEIELLACDVDDALIIVLLRICLDQFDDCGGYRA